MPCSPQSSTGCCTCMPKEGGLNTPWGHCPSLPLAESPAPQGIKGKGWHGGVSCHLTVTLTLQLDQVSSAPSMLSVCSREVYASLMLLGIKFSSLA